MRRLVLVLAAVLAAACQDAEPVVSDAESPSVTEEASPTPTTTTSPVVPETEVPRVEGKQLKTARQRLENAHLDVAVETKLTNQAPEGAVLRQTPKPGAVVEEGELVQLVVAEALPVIPNVVGKRVAPARRTLENRGFDVRVTKQESSQPKDTVLSQSPAGGTSVRPGRIVTIVVAKPPPPPPPSNCTPGYSPCLPLGPSDYDCYGGSGDGPAYTEPGVVYTVTGSDPYGLDSDNDGRGCE